MHVLTQKTTIFFPQDLYQKLKDLAKITKTSVANLIREAVIEQYLLSDKKKRLLAVEHLSHIGGKVSDWQTLEKELTKDYL